MLAMQPLHYVPDPRRSRSTGRLQPPNVAPGKGLRPLSIQLESAANHVGLGKEIEPRIAQQ